MTERAAGGEELAASLAENEARRRVPEELQATMTRALGGQGSPTALDVLAAAERLLDQVLRSECEHRSSALDLLTVDALMTQALEIAGRDSVLLETFPEIAMRRVAAR